MGLSPALKQAVDKLSSMFRVDIKYIVVCTDHGAIGPMSLEAADITAAGMNSDGECFYKVLPLIVTTDAS